MNPIEFAKSKENCCNQKENGCNTRGENGCNKEAFPDKLGQAYCKLVNSANKIFMYAWYNPQRNSSPQQSIAFPFPSQM